MFKKFFRQIFGKRDFDCLGKQMAYCKITGRKFLMKWTLEFPRKCSCEGCSKLYKAIDDRVEEALYTPTKPEERGK